MIRLPLLAAAVLAASSSIVLAQAVPPGTVELSNQHAIELANAIGELDRQICTGPEPAPGKPDTRDCKPAYKLGALRGTLSTDVERLKPIIEAYNDAIRKSYVEVVGSDRPQAMPVAPAVDATPEVKTAYETDLARWRDLDAKVQAAAIALSRQTHPVSIDHFPYSALKVGDGDGENTIPMRVLAI